LKRIIKFLKKIESRGGRGKGRGLFGNMRILGKVLRRIA